MAIYKLGAQYKPTAELEDFVGEVGDLFFSTSDPYVRISDGQTPGGIRVVPDLTAATDGNMLMYNATKKTFESVHVPQTVQLFQDGLLEDTQGTVRWYAPADLTVSRVSIRIGDQSNVDIEVTIKKSESIVQTVTLPAGRKKVVENQIEFTMEEDDYLTVDVICPGNSTGTRLSVEFSYSWA